jgi:hypothetical protein
MRGAASFVCVRLISAETGLTRHALDASLQTQV